MNKEQKVNIEIVSQDIFHSFQAFLHCTDNTGLAHLAFADTSMRGIDIEKLMAYGLIFRPFDGEVKQSDGVDRHFPRYPYKLTQIGNEIKEGSRRIYPEQ